MGILNNTILRKDKIHPYMLNSCMDWNTLDSPIDRVSILCCHNRLRRLSLGMSIGSIASGIDNSQDYMLCIGIMPALYMTNTKGDTNHNDPLYPHTFLQDNFPHIAHLPAWMYHNN